LHVFRVDTNQNKQKRHVLPANQENIKQKNDKQIVSTVMQEKKPQMMPVFLPVTIALKGGIKQN